MKNTLIANHVIAIISAVLFVCSIATGQEMKQKTLSPKGIISNLSWLEGSWGCETFTAHYTSPLGGIILSVSKELNEGKAEFFEFETITAKDSTVILTPYPDGQRSVAFTLINYDPAIKKTVFENKEHDFPTRLSYESVSDDNLLIIVSGPQEGKTVDLRFDLFRK